MAFSHNALRLVFPRFAAGYPAIYRYVTTDTDATIQGAGYFAQAGDAGVQIQDFILIARPPTGFASIHVVVSMSGIAATTILQGQTLISNANVLGDGLQAYTPCMLIYPLTVAALPPAVAALKGWRAYVTDATVTTFASTVVGGGTNGVPVYCDGTNWKIG